IPPAGKGTIKVEDLGESTPIDAAVEEFRTAMTQVITKGTVPDKTSEEAVRAPLAKLSRAVLGPLDPYIRDASHWMFSPDANLWFVPWAALPVANNQFAVESHKITCLVSGRDLVNQVEQTDKPQLTPALVLADPD